MKEKEKNWLSLGTLVLFSAVMIALYGCGEPELGTIEIAPEKKTLAVGETVTFKAASLSTKGEEMPNLFVEWRVKGEAGAIDNTGIFTAQKPGEVTVIAGAQGISGQAQVVVQPASIANLKLKPETGETLPEATLKITVFGTTAEGRPAGFHEIQVATPTKGAQLSAKTVHLDESGRAAFDLVVPQLPGKVLVTVSVDEVSAETGVSVQPRPVTRIEVAPESERALTETEIPVRVKGLSDENMGAALNRIKVSSPTEGTVLSTDEVNLDEHGEARFEVILSPQPGENRIVLESDQTTRELGIEGTRIERIEITPEKETFEVGQEIAFTATGYDRYGNGRPIQPEWSLSGDSALLTEGAVVEMKSTGKAILLARFKGLDQGHPFSIVPGQPAEITIRPDTAELKVGESLTFDADIFNAQGYPLEAPIQWKTDGDIGTIAEDGTFLSETAGKGRVIAVSGRASAVVPVQVVHGPLADMIIELEKQILTAGEKVTLSAQGVDAFGNRFLISPRWFLSASLGKIDQEASTFMPLRAGSGEILAKVGNVVQGVGVEVVPAEMARLQVEPSAVDMIAGETVQFEVTGYDRFGNSVDVKPDFSVLAPLGELDATGRFTAKTSGSTVVKAKAGGLVGESTLAVVPAEMKAAEISPKAPVNLTAGKAEEFTASGYDAYGNTVKATVSWDMHPDLGTINIKGVFFPEKAGKTRLVATLRQLRTGKEMAVPTEVSVGPGGAAYIRIEPESLEVTAGETVIFSATAYDRFENPTEVAINWQVKPSRLGRISREGRFTAITADTGSVLARYGNVTGRASVAVTAADVAFLKIIPEEIHAEAGETVSLKTVMEDRFGNVVDGDVTWDLSDESLGRITGDNELITKKAGKGTLIAAAYNIADSVPLTVREGRLHRIELNPAEKMIPSGSTVQFDSAGFDAGGNPVSVDIEWSVEGDIGHIDDTGNFTAIKAGAGKVVVHHGDIEAASAVRVTPGSPAHITLQPGSFTVTAGETHTLNFEVKDSHGNIIPSPDVSWVISDKLGRIIGQNRFKAQKAGEGEIRLRAGDQMAQSTVTVKPGPIHTVTVEPTTVSLRAGEQQDFFAQGYDSQGNPLDLEPTWSISGGIGSVNQTGGFTATSVGNGFVTARMKDAVAVAQMTVTPGPVDRVGITPDTLELKAGADATFSATAYDACGNITPAEISWSLKATDPIGDISDEARFTARRTGKGEVVAAAGSVKGRAQVQVVPSGLDRIVLSPKRLTLKSGDTIQVNATGRDAYGNVCEIDPRFTLSPEAIGSINASGRLTALKAVSGQLRVSADGITAAAPVIVEPGALASLQIRLPDQTLRAGNTYPFEVIGYDAGGNEVPAKADWSISHGIGSMEKTTGVFHARKAGSGLVVAASDGIVVHRTLTVEPGALYSLFVEPNPVTVTSNTTQQFEVSGLDVAENPVAVSEAAVEWDIVGDIGEFEAPGRFRGTRMGRGKVIARSGDLLGEAYVTVVPGKPEPKNSRVRVTYPTLPADGAASAEIILEIRDSYHNPVPGIQATIVSSRQEDTLDQPDETNKQGEARGRIRSNQTGLSVVRAIVDETPLVDTARVHFE